MTPDEEVEFWVRAIQAAVALLAAWLAASALKTRKKALRNRLDLLFSGSDAIETKQFVTRENVKIERLGIIRKQEGKFTFEFLEEGSRRDYRTFSTLEELEKYLLDETCFRLGDFARPATITGS